MSWARRILNEISFSDNQREARATAALLEVLPKFDFEPHRVQRMGWDDFAKSKPGQGFENVPSLEQGGELPKLYDWTWPDTVTKKVIKKANGFVLFGMLVSVNDWGDDTLSVRVTVWDPSDMVYDKEDDRSYWPDEDHEYSFPLDSEGDFDTDGLIKLVTEIQDQLRIYLK